MCKFECPNTYDCPYFHVNETVKDFLCFKDATPGLEITINSCSAPLTRADVIDIFGIHSYTPLKNPDLKADRDFIIFCFNLVALFKGLSEEDN